MNKYKERKDLPPELLAQLSKRKADYALREIILDVIHEQEEADIDTVLVELYRITNTVYKRHMVNQRLNDMKKRGEIGSTKTGVFCKMPATP